MTTVTISGLVFYVFVVIFSNSVNTAQVSRIQAYYRKNNVIVKIQSRDFYSNLSAKKNDEAGKQWQEIQDMNNILVLGGWENIEYFEFKSKPPVKITILLNQIQKLYETNYSGIYLIELGNSKKDFIEYNNATNFKDDVLYYLTRQ